MSAGTTGTVGVGIISSIAIFLHDEKIIMLDREAINSMLESFMLRYLDVTLHRYKLKLGNAKLNPRNGDIWVK